MMSKNKAEVDGRECTCLDCFCIWCGTGGAIEYFTRQQIRSKFGYDYHSCTDCLLLCLCTHCVICQDARELKNKAGGGMDK